MADAVLLFDGECGFCDRVVQFIIRRDRRKRFRFAALQTGYGRKKATAAGLNPDDLSTMVLILNPDSDEEKVLIKGRAAFTVYSMLGGGWAILGWFRFLPKGLLNFGYDLVARNRFRIAGRLDTCRIPTPEERERFIL
jgi:predicted DCC family thiol-disulfide oxidoreductase YuxK